MPGTGEAGRGHAKIWDNPQSFGTKKENGNVFPCLANLQSRRWTLRRWRREREGGEGMGGGVGGVRERERERQRDRERQRQRDRQRERDGR